MAKAPKSPRRASQRRRPATTGRATVATSPPVSTVEQSPPPQRSTAGRITAAVLGVASAAGVFTGLYEPTAKAPATCGGTERWNVKVANDPDATGGKVNLNPTGTPNIAALNAIVPGQLDAGGRMAVEEKEYTVSGYLSYFKHEADGDYHVVISDQPGGFAKGTKAQPNGSSMVVEFPDANCFMGKSGLGPPTSALGQAIADARASFEQHTSGLNGASIANPPKVVVTGVGFFDFDHGQTGRATPHPGVDGQGKVFELHPVTSITFPETTDE